MPRPPVWFLTGISRGLGRALAETLLARGAIVVGTTRDGHCDLTGPAGHLFVVPLDVSVAGQVQAAVEQAVAAAGRIDVVVNNAGYGLLGSVEETGDEVARALFDVNFFGAFDVLRAVVPRLRVQRSGHIVNVSSIAGLDPNAGSGAYAASKAALAALSHALAAELAPLGVGVTVVSPGAFRTEFLSRRSLRTIPTTIADYDGTVGAVLQRLVPGDGLQPGDPRLAAEAIIDAVTAPEPPLDLVLGADALERTRRNFERLSGDLDRWEFAARDTAFSES
jgi:NAD(P)-dependent dehydrogenase (short-subunit alcohol dehydrogenase family)